MLRLSKKTLFAIEAVLDIAYHAGPAPVQSTEITRRQGIPRRYLEQALQYLARSKILVGVRGPRGGYRLARERRRITVADVVRVVGDMETADDPTEASEGSPLGRTVIRPMWRDMQDELMSKLEEVTIDDLCSRARSQGIVSEKRSVLDFTI